MAATAQEIQQGYRLVNGRKIPVNFMGNDITGTYTPNFDSMNTQLQTDFDNAMIPTTDMKMYDTTPKTGWEQTKDFLGSDTFSNTMQGVGMGLSALQGYKNYKETKKHNQRMFDLEKGQVDRANAYQDTFQKNYTAGR